MERGGLGQKMNGKHTDHILFEYRGCIENNKQRNELGMVSSRLFFVSEDSDWGGGWTLHVRTICP